MDTEFLRQQYCPKQIKVLFVGESAPTSGKFFYSANSILFSATYEAFGNVFPQIPQTQFLENFRRLGFYLHDLCDRPVDKFAEIQRLEACILGVPILKEKLKLWSPLAIVVVIKRIVPFVKQAMQDCGDVDIPIHELTFPRGDENRNRYVLGLERLLDTFRQGGLILRD